jgi:hypothetical protein
MLQHLLLTNLGWLVALCGLLIAIPLGKLTVAREEAQYRRRARR